MRASGVVVLGFCSVGNFSSAVVRGRIIVSQSDCLHIEFNTERIERKKQYMRVVVVVAAIHRTGCAQIVGRRRSIQRGARSFVSG